MALSNLALSFVESNDNTKLVMTDITGTDGATDWGVGANPNYDHIDGSDYDLELDIVITTADGTETTYDTIDLYAEFGPFVSYNNLSFDIDCTQLKVDGVAIGTDEDEIPDGIWGITYTLVDLADSLNNVEYSGNILINGVVKQKVYEMLKDIPMTYQYGENVDSYQIREAMFAYSYLIAIESSAYISKKVELLNQLGVLERIVSNGSNNTW